VAKKKLGVRKYKKLIKFKKHRCRADVAKKLGVEEKSLLLSMGMVRRFFFLGLLACSFFFLVREVWGLMERFRQPPNFLAWAHLLSMGVVR
jgi:hypothetical protein